MISELSEPGFIGFAGLPDFINQDGKSREFQKSIQIPVQTALRIEADTGHVVKGLAQYERKARTEDNAIVDFGFEMFDFGFLSSGFLSR